MGSVNPLLTSQPPTTSYSSYTSWLYSKELIAIIGTALSWPILCMKLLYKLGKDFLDIQYRHDIILTEKPKKSGVFFKSFSFAYYTSTKRNSDSDVKKNIDYSAINLSTIFMRKKKYVAVYLNQIPNFTIIN